MSSLPLFRSNQVVRANILLVGFVAFSIVLPIRANAIISVGLLSVYFIYAIVRRKVDLDFFKTPLFILVAVHFAIQLLGLLHSANLSQGYADIERYFFALLFPFFIWLIRKNGVTTSHLISVFLVGTVGLTLYAIGNSIFFLEGNQRENVFELGHTYFADSIFIHPSYLSIYLIFGFFFLLEKGRTYYLKLSKIELVALTMVLVYIVGMLFLLRSQMNLIIFVLLCVLYIIIVYKKRAWLMTFLMVTACLMVFLLDTKRVSTFFDTYGKNVSSALDNRFNVWGGAVEAIKSAPFLGAGTGSEQLALNAGYLKKGYKEGVDNSYNAHNQFLQFWIRNGFIELACFVALLVYSFRQSLKSSNYTFLMFNMAFSLCMLTESCLSVHKGIVFFYFFLSAFIFLPFESLAQVDKG